MSPGSPPRLDVQNGDGTWNGRCCLERQRGSRGDPECVAGLRGGKGPPVNMLPPHFLEHQHVNFSWSLITLSDFKSVRFCFSRKICLSLIMVVAGFVFC